MPPRRLLLLALLANAAAFSPSTPPRPPFVVLRSSPSDDAVDASPPSDDAGATPVSPTPASMKMSEITAELQLRGVRYDDCFDRDSLSQRLAEARVSGRADPKMLDNFNKKRLEDTVAGKPPPAVSDEDLRAAVAGDGTLPGGMPPDMLQELMSNPEIMALLQSPKMQDVMKIMMTGGQGEVAKAMRDDPEVKELVTKLDFLIHK
mmetsp:Transcript_25115/g.58058  ORF Transcript_25115/g.58058 Transcript_25115/m.58058 type:complete len:205 (-) Transcript_25115:191-805(-)